MQPEPENLAEATVHEMAAKREQEQAAAKIIEMQIKVVSATFDKSVAYTNLIILAAYAGFFGLWQLTKEFLSKQIALWSALLMLISIVTFVLFEVVKMVIIQHNIQQQGKALKLPQVKHDPQALAKAFADLEAVYERVTLYLMRFWVSALLITIICGMMGASLLGYAFVTGLMGKT